MGDPGLLRIGELSRRSGVAPKLLRARERRYGLLSPVRSQGGPRLYSFEDLKRVRQMQHPHREELRELARGQRVCPAGAGVADAPLDLDVELLRGQPVEEAERLTTLLEAR